MFAFLALAGDLGCSGGPTLVGYVAGLMQDDLKKGILAGGIFPLLLILGIMMLKRRNKDVCKENRLGIDDSNEVKHEDITYQ